MDDENDCQLFAKHLIGYCYQLKLLLLFFYRGWKNNYIFKLKTEVEDAEKFDDIVFYFKKKVDDMEYDMICLQAKHARNIKELTYKNFVSTDYKEICNLQKYFISFQKIKQKSAITLPSTLILCNNYSMPVLKMLKRFPCNAIDETIIFEDIEERENVVGKIFDKWGCYKIKQLNKEAKEMLKNGSNLSLLAKEIFESIQTCEKNGETIVKLSMKNYYILLYHNALMNDKIFATTDTAKFRYDFITGDYKKASSIQEFRKRFISLFEKHGEFNALKMVKLNIDFLQVLQQKKNNNPTTLEDEKQIAEDLIKQIFCPSKISDDNIIMKNSDKIKEIINRGKQMRFSESFFQGSNESVSKFRDIILEKYKSYLIKKFKDETLSISDEEPKFGDIDLCNQLTFCFIYKKISQITIDICNKEYKFFEITADKKAKVTNALFSYKDQKIKKFRDELVKNLAIEKLKMFEFTFEQRGIGKELDNLAEQIIQHVKDGKNVMNYSAETAKTLNELADIIFNHETENKFMQFKPCFLSEEKDIQEIEKFDKEFKKALSIFREKLKTGLSEMKKDLEYLQTFAFEIQTYPYFCKTLSEFNENIDGEIEDFKNKLLIVTTPNEQELFEIVERELGDEFNILNEKIVGKEIFHNILEWAKLNDGVPLTNEEIETFFDTIKEIISGQLVSGLHREYRGILRKQNINFHNAEVSWEEVLCPQNISFNQLLILRSNIPILTAIKIEQILRKFEYYNNINALIFHKLSSLWAFEYYEIANEKQKNVSTAFATKDNNNLMIIQDDTISETVTQHLFFLKKLSSIALKNRAKRIVLIVSEKSILMENMMQNKKFSAYKIINDNNIFADLDSSSQKKLLQKRVKFQGNTIFMNQISDDYCFFNNSMDSETLSNLLESDTDNLLEIGKLSKKFKGYNEECYCERKVLLEHIDKSIFDTCFKMENHISCFYGMYKDRFEVLLDKFNIKINTVEYPGDFCEHEYTPKTCFIVRKDGSGGAGYSYISDDGIQYDYKANTLHFVETAESLNVYVEEDFFSVYIQQYKIVLITDSAGMGKSTFLSSLEQKIRKNIGEKKWVLRINLNEYTEILREIDVSITHTDEEFQFHYPLSFDCYETILLNSLTMTIPKKDKVKTFENYLFEYLFKNGKIVVIFDGYDEVGTKYRKLLISWILRLKNKTANQIWICSRSCFKEELEKELATSSFSLKILSNYDQEKIMRNIWENHWQGEMTETEKSHMDLYMITLITKFSKTLEDNEKYAGCPLHIIMLADVFMENKEPGTDWEGCFDFMKNNNSCTRYSCLHTSDRNFIPTKLEHLYSLYEKFVMQKIKKHFFEDKGIFGSTRDMVECYKNKEFLKFKKMHEMLAVRFLGEDAKFNEIFEESGKEKLQKWLKQFGTHDAGIIDTTATSSHPIFIHSNYAEYFAACCLIDIVQTKKELVLKFIYDILQNDVIVFSHCAKNLLAEKYENYGVSGFVNDVKTVSTLNEKERYFLIKWFMDDEKIENKLPKIDTTGKTYLHCAVASEISETVVYVLLHTYVKLITRNEGIGDDVLSHIIRSEEALFLLSEYVSLKDDNEMTAVMYSSNPDITNLLNEILKIGQNSTKPKEYANNIKTIIIEKPVKIKMISTSLEYLRKNDKIYYNNCYPLAWKLSFESLKTILTHSSADILINMLQCTATNFTIFDVICNRTDFDDEERLNLFKCWWDNQLIKDLSKQQEAGNCILIAAVENDNVELFNYFLNFLLSDSFVFSVDAIVKCFSAACGANILRFVKLLYENHPAEISNCLPLHLATENNANLKIIEYICTHINPDINSINEKKEVALIQLMKRDFEYYKIKYFLEHGANVNIVDRMNVYSAWNYAFRSYDDDIIKLFLDCENLEILESELCLKTMKEYYQNEDFCVDIKVDNTFRLFEAIINRDTTLVLFLIWKNGDVNVEDEYGKTALHYACETAEEKIVRILIYNGTMFDKADIFEKKPIEYCGENKRNITLLSDIEWAFNNINNPDVTKNHTSRYHFLNSFIRNKDGDTLLHLMAKNKINDSYNDIIRKYFSGFYEITLNVRNVNGNTVLHFVAEQNNLNFVKELLENGAYYNMLNNFGKTPEDLAPKNGHVKNLLHSVEHLFNIADSDNTAEIGLSIIKVLSFFENNKLCLHKLRNNEGQALLHRIILNTNEDHARSVVRYLHTPEPVYEEIMISLIQQNKSKHVKEMMNAGTFFNIRMFNLLKDKESNECVKQFAKIAELFDLAHKENIDGLKEILDNTKFELDVVNIYSTFANYRQPENLTSLRGPFYRIYRILEFIIRTSNYHMIEHLLKMGSKVHVDFDRVKNKKTRQLLTLYASFKKNI